MEGEDSIVCLSNTSWSTANFSCNSKLERTAVPLLSHGKPTPIYLRQRYIISALNLSMRSSQYQKRLIKHETCKFVNYFPLRFVLKLSLAASHQPYQTVRPLSFLMTTTASPFFPVWRDMRWKGRIASCV